MHLTIFLGAFLPSFGLQVLQNGTALHAARIAAQSRLAPTPWGRHSVAVPISCLDDTMQQRLPANGFDYRFTWNRLLDGLPPDSQRECRYGGCEALRVYNFVRAPANAWSSAAFLVSGVLLAADSFWRTPAMPLVSMSAITGPAHVYLSFVSWAYHASISGTWHTYDQMGMHFVMVCGCLGSLPVVCELLTGERRLGAGMDAACCLLCAGLFAIWVVEADKPPPGLFAMNWSDLFVRFLVLAISGAMLQLTTIVLLLRSKLACSRCAIWSFFAAVLSVVALACGWADQTRFWCCPHSLLQGTACLHVFGAGGLYSLRTAQQAAADAIRQQQEAFCN